MHVIATVDILKKYISIQSYRHALLQVNGLSFYGFLLFHNFLTLGVLFVIVDEGMC